MKTLQNIKLLLLFFFVSAINHAQVNTEFNGIDFGESLLIVQNKLTAISGAVSVIKTATPSFPLSEHKEEHLIASNVRLENGIIDKVVFTFSDDKLSYIQAKGNVFETLTSELKSEMKTYLDYQIYFSELLFINTKTDVAWLLTPESVHPNLFTWNNPYLSTHVETSYNPSVKIPSFIKMGEHLDIVLPLLKENSEFIEIENLSGDDTTVKIQVNCFGIEYAGFPRKFEARFKNGTLEMVWILTGKGEENRIREKLTEEYGTALFTNNEWEVFNNWTVLLRKDKPEILLLTKELGLLYKEQYTK